MKYLLLLTLLIPSSLSAGTISESHIDKALRIAANANDVPFRLLKAICRVESNLNPTALNKNDYGSPSYGLCQIKEATARLVHYRGTTRDLLNPYINANISARYLRKHLTRYNNDWVRATSAYNAGSCRKILKNNRYIKKVMSKLEI